MTPNLGRRRNLQRHSQEKSRHKWGSPYVFLCEWKLKISAKHTHTTTNVHTHANTSFQKNANTHKYTHKHWQFWPSHGKFCGPIVLFKIEAKNITYMFQRKFRNCSKAKHPIRFEYVTKAHTNSILPQKDPWEWKLSFKVQLYFVCGWRHQ